MIENHLKTLVEHVIERIVSGVTANILAKMDTPGEATTEPSPASSPDSIHEAKPEPKKRGRKSTASKVAAKVKAEEAALHGNPDAPDEVDTTARGKPRAGGSVAPETRPESTYDLADSAIYKRLLVEIAQGSGVPNSMALLKGFIKDMNYGSADEVPVDERDVFVDAFNDFMSGKAGAQAGLQEEFDI